MTFDNLEIIEPLLRALNHEGYSTPTPIQQQAIPVILNNHDVLGCAQTGTGKTAAFSIPILQNIYKATTKGQRREVKALVLTPTRELAVQIDESFAAYGRYTDLRHTVIYGGVGQRTQTDALRRGVDILVATPGRLLDLMNQGYVDLRRVEFLYLTRLTECWIWDSFTISERLYPKSLKKGRLSSFQQLCLMKLLIWQRVFSEIR